jgi:hypothetical protein
MYTLLSKYTMSIFTHLLKTQAVYSSKRCSQTTVYSNLDHLFFFTTVKT